MPLTVVEARGFIKNYTIAYTPIICSQKRQQSIAVHKIVAGDQSSTTVDGLDENAAYAVQMFATTGGGQGKIETIVGVSTFSKHYNIEVAILIIFKQMHYYHSVMFSR